MWAGSCALGLAIAVLYGGAAADAEDEALFALPIEFEVEEEGEAYVEAGASAPLTALAPKRCKGDEAELSEGSWASETTVGGGESGTAPEPAPELNETLPSSTGVLLVAG